MPHPNGELTKDECVQESQRLLHLAVEGDDYEEAMRLRLATAANGYATLALVAELGRSIETRPV